MPHLWKILAHLPHHELGPRDVEPSYATGALIHSGALPARLMIDFCRFGYIPTMGSETSTIVRILFNPPKKA